MLIIYKNAKYIFFGDFSILLNKTLSILDPFKSSLFSLCG